MPILFSVSLTVALLVASAGGGRTPSFTLHAEPHRAPQVAAGVVPPLTVTSPASQDSARIRATAQDIVRAFAAEVARVRGTALGVAPIVMVDNTPQLIFFDPTVNRIVVPWWAGMPPEGRSIFLRFAGGNAERAERLFATVFNGFLVAHEAGHWYQQQAGRAESTLYANEKAANEMAVAFWRTQPQGEALLAEMEALVTLAAESVPDPTPRGEDPVAYFGAHYQELGADPLKYGYYQFRFMRDALRIRSTLDLDRLLSARRLPPAM